LAEKLGNKGLRMQLHWCGQYVLADLAADLEVQSVLSSCPRQASGLPLQVVARQFDFQANILHDDAASCLASALKNCDGLLRLDLQQNALQAPLPFAAMHCHSLHRRVLKEVISSANVQIYRQDGQHLGELIAGHSQLTRLDGTG